MFRLLSVNGQQSLRPVIFLKVRTGKLGITLPGSTSSGIPNGTSGQNANQYIIPCQFTRQNSGVAQSSNTSAKVDAFVNKVQRDPIFREVIDSETKTKLNYFKEQLSLAFQYRSMRDRDGKRAFRMTMDNLFKALEDEGLRAAFVSKDLYNYSQILNYAVYSNRTTRLSGSRNRDSDQYQNENLLDEVLIRTAVLDISEFIINGEFNNILNENILLYIFFSMKQFQLHTEMLNLWEVGVNDSHNGKLYLNEKILAVILPIAYSQKRFNYEEILHIYDINTKEKKSVLHELLCSIGKIAITAGDYAKGLDALEELLKKYESKGSSSNHVLTSLGELHLNFIGYCKDIKIAKHFFDKVIQYDLPYYVCLKVPYIQSLLQNCFELNEPFDNLLYFWKSTVNHYHQEKSSNHLNSRYSILNNTFFTIFFKSYPDLTEESFNKLKDIIATYAQIKPVDEVFLNTIIGNYSWGNKEVLEHLIENYETFGVSRTPVSYRICLKKTGLLPDYTNDEILQKWNQSLQHLDESRMNYIPIADWAALRDATILSDYSTERKLFYLAVLNKYKDFIQDERSCLRFAKYWLKKSEHINDIKKITYGNTSEFENSTALDSVPQFRYLKPNVNYKRISASIFG